MSTKRIIFVDASLLKGSACLRRVWRTTVDGYRGKINSVDIEYGSAFHIFAQTFVDTKGNQKEAMDKTVKYFQETPYEGKKAKDWMTIQHLKKTCFDWVMYWESKGDNLEPLIIDGAKTTELKFAFPYLQTSNFEIHLSGTIDSIRQVKGQGAYVVLDYKTTSSWDQRGYLEQYKLDPQLPFYRLAIQKYAEFYPNSIFGQMISKGIGCCIEGIFVGSTKEATIARTDVKFFKSQEMQQFEMMLNRKVRDLADWLDSDFTEMSISGSHSIPPKEGILNAACYGSKFGCPFTLACGAPDEIAEGHVLKSNYKQTLYDPRNFR